MFWREFKAHAQHKTSCFILKYMCLIHTVVPYPKDYGLLGALLSFVSWMPFFFDVISFCDNHSVAMWNQIIWDDILHHKYRPVSSIENMTFNWQMTTGWKQVGSHFLSTWCLIASQLGLSLVTFIKRLPSWFRRLPPSSIPTTALCIHHHWYWPWWLFG